MTTTATLIRYKVAFSDSKEIFEVYDGFDKSEAMRLYEDADTTHLEDMLYSYDLSISIEELKETYSFIYELQEDEELADYPLVDYYGDCDIWQLEDVDYEIVSHKELGKQILDAGDIETLIQEKLAKRFGNGSYKAHGKYNYFTSRKGLTQLRVASHTHNTSNDERFSANVDYFISIVITDKDPTDDHFYGRDDRENAETCYFSSKDGLAKIKEEIKIILQLLGVEL